MPRRLAALDLAGARARLRPHRAEDADAAYALLAGQDEILRWLVWDGPLGAEELVAHYRGGGFEEGGTSDLRLAIEERASGALAGSITLRFGGHPGQGDLGYWVGVPFQRRGLGREAIELAAHLAFAHLGAASLYAWVFVGNVASRRVLEHAGFTLVRTVPGRIRKRGTLVDEWHFVLLLAEWRRLRSAFRPEHATVGWEEEDARGALDAAARPFPRG
jgi:ribosomal-protein-alanine N-acetyltransferase